ncbi:MAG: TIM barrel protein, partial [Chloroflexota bacterium]
VASYAFHGLVKAGMMDVFGYLETVKYRYGLHSADIWNGMLPSMDEEYLKKVREALDERELELANLCVDGAHIWEADPAARERNRQNAVAALKAAEILGAKTVRIDAGSRDEAFSQEQLDLIIKRYKEYCQRAYDGGFKLGPENHWGPERTLAGLKAIHDGVASPAFGVLLHFGNWTGPGAEGGDAFAAPWAMHTHVSMGIVETCLNVKMEMLRAAGYAGYWGIEFHAAAREYAQVGVMVARVRDQLDQWRVAGA